MQYQGYTNHATWVVNLWLTNTRKPYDVLMEIVGDSIFWKTKKQKANALEDYVKRNINATPLYKDGEPIQIDSRGENWPLGIVQDFNENDKITDVNWSEIIEVNSEQ